MQTGRWSRQKDMESFLLLLALPSASEVVPQETPLDHLKQYEYRIIIIIIINLLLLFDTQ